MRVKSNSSFIQTKNVRSFLVSMNAVLHADEGVLVAVWGRAGRGKTRTSIEYHAEENCVYRRALKLWTELWMLQDLCFELGVRKDQLPGRKAKAWAIIVDSLKKDPRPVFIDEADKINHNLLEVVRDLADITGCPFVLVGEEELLPLMERNRRVWSRTCQAVKFGPIDALEAVYYAKKSLEVQNGDGSWHALEIPEEGAKLLEDASGGDFRLIKRDSFETAKIAAANGTHRPTVEMVEKAIKQGLRGK